MNAKKSWLVDATGFSAEHEDRRNVLYAQLTHEGWLSSSYAVFQKGGKRGTAALAFMRIDIGTKEFRLLPGTATPETWLSNFDDAPTSDERIDEAVATDPAGYATKAMEDAASLPGTRLGELARLIRRATANRARQRRHRQEQKKLREIQRSLGRKGHVFYVTDAEKVLLIRQLHELRKDL